MPNKYLFINYFINIILYSFTTTKMSRKQLQSNEDVDPQWQEFKNQNPTMFDFFNMKFGSLKEFTEQLEIYCNTFFQLLNTENSYLIKNNDQLFQRFKYDRLRLKCVHGGSGRSNNI